MTNQIHLIVDHAISLLSVFDRIFEKIMHYPLKSFLKEDNILHDSQYGFREKRFTEHSLLMKLKLTWTDNCAHAGLLYTYERPLTSILLKKSRHYILTQILNHLKS